MDTEGDFAGKRRKLADVHNGLNANESPGEVQGGSSIVVEGSLPHTVAGSLQKATTPPKPSDENIQDHSLRNLVESQAQTISKLQADLRTQIQANKELETRVEILQSQFSQHFSSPQWPAQLRPGTNVSGTMEETDSRMFLPSISLVAHQQAPFGYLAHQQGPGAASLLPQTVYMPYMTSTPTLSYFPLATAQGAPSTASSMSIPASPPPSTVFAAQQQQLQQGGGAPVSGVGSSSATPSYIVTSANTSPVAQHHSPQSTSSTSAILGSSAFRQPPPMPRSTNISPNPQRRNSMPPPSPNALVSLARESSLAREVEHGESHGTSLHPEQNHKRSPARKQQTTNLSFHDGSVSVPEPQFHKEGLTTSEAKGTNANEAASSSLHYFVLQANELIPAVLIPNSPTTLKLDLFHKPRGSQGEWRLVHVGQNLRVTKQRGKLVRLVIRSALKYNWDHARVKLLFKVTAEEAAELAAKNSLLRSIDGNTDGVRWFESISKEVLQVDKKHISEEPGQGPDGASEYVYQMAVKVFPTRSTISFRLEVALADSPTTTHTCTSVEIHTHDSGRRD